MRWDETSRFFQLEFQGNVLVLNLGTAREQSYLFSFALQNPICRGFPAAPEARGGLPESVGDLGQEPQGHVGHIGRNLALTIPIATSTTDLWLGAQRCPEEHCVGVATLCGGGHQVHFSFAACSVR